MTTWFVNEDFEEEDFDYDVDGMPWDQGYTYDQVILYVTLNNTRPKSGDYFIKVFDGSNVSIDRWLPGINRLKWTQWKGPLRPIFFETIIKTIFEEDIRKIKK